MFPTLPKTWNETKFDYSFLHQMMEMFILAGVSFFLPVFLQHPQLLIGAAVNALLIRGAFSLKGYRILPVIVMPSLGAVTAGILFGSLTKFLIYFIPLIWIGNALLVHLVKVGMKKNYLRVLTSAAFIKSSFLGVAALALYSLEIVPGVFLGVMSYWQFLTAFLGGVLVYGELQIEKRWFPQLSSE